MRPRLPQHREAADMLPEATSESDVEAGDARRMRLLSASRLNDFLGCAHQAALWLADVPVDAAVDETLELVRRKGFAHEEDVLARLEAEHGRAVRIASTDPLEARQAATLTAMKQGETLIYQG